MVDLAATFMKMQAYVGLPTANSAPSGGKADTKVRDAFSSLFDNTVRNSFAVKTETTVKSAESAAPEGNELSHEGEELELEGEEKTGKIPDELAILASYTIQTPQIEPETVTEESQVVSILEGNMDIEAPLPDVKTEAPVLQEQSLPVEAPVQEETGEELTARMPQAPEQIQQTAETEKQPETIGKTIDKTNAEAPAEDEGPCPLENKNDSPQTKSSLDSDEETKEETKTDYSRAPETQQKMDISPDRVASAEKLNAAANNQATATTETLFDTMVEKIQMANTSESAFMEIQLKPEFLGKVSIQLALGDSGMEIRIKTEDAGVKGLLSEQLNQLKDALQDKGIKVMEVEVTQTNITDHAFGENASHGKEQAYQTNEGARPGRSGDLSVSQAGSEGSDADAAPVLDTGTSSVEYRA